MLRRRNTPAHRPPLRPTLAALAAVILVGVGTLGPSSGSAGNGDDNPPTTPGHLIVAGVTQTSVTLTWLPATDDVGVVRYSVLWNTRRPKDAEDTLLPTFTKTGLACGASYAVQVYAVDAAGNSSNLPSEAIVATGACIDVTAPSAPSGVSQVAQTETSATLSWTPSTDNVGVAGYAVSRNGVPVGATTSPSHTITGLTCGSGYSAVVQAFDAAGNRSAPTSYTGAAAPCADHTPPTTPPSLRQVGSTNDAISIAWGASTDESGVSGYGVYADGSLVSSTSALSTLVLGLACGRTYTIGVDAVDRANNRSSRAAAQMATHACSPNPGGTRDTTPPTTPTGLTVASLSAGSAALKWNPSTDNVGVTAYSVFNGPNYAGDTPGASFVLTSVACGTTVEVGVEAKDAAGNRSGRATQFVGTHPCSDSTPPTQPGPLTLQTRTETSITVGWSPSTDASGVAGYGVYRDGPRVATPTTNSYTFTDLACGKSYTLGADAVDTVGNRSTQSVGAFTTLACSDIVPPTAPAGLAVSNVTSTTLTLKWNASTDVGGILGYDVFVNGTKSATTATLQAAIGSLLCGTTVQLGVEAFDKSGNRSTRAATTVAMLACSPGGTVPTGGTLYVAPGGSDAGTCASAAPCASFDRAYQVAKPGQVVEVAGGSYGSQVIMNRDALRNLSPGCEPGSTANCVVFRPAPGATVRINGVLEVRGSSVWVDGTASGSILSPESRSYNIQVTGYLDTEAGSESNYPDHVILDGIDATNIGAFNVDTVTFQDIDVGPATVTSGCAIREGPGFENKIGFGGGVTYVPRNVTFDRVVIHDQNGDQGRIGSDCHFGGLFVVTVDGLTIRNSIFSQNVVYNIQIQNFSGRAPTNVTMENNWFGCPVEWLYVSATTCDNQPDVQFNAASMFSNYLFRYNSFAAGLGQMVGGASYSNVRVYGNAGSGPSQCFSGWTFGYNAWDKNACASTDVSLGSLPFVDPRPGQENLRLSPGSRAIDLVTATASEYVIGSDIAGSARPLGGARDAGATETG